MWKVKDPMGAGGVQRVVTVPRNRQCEPSRGVLAVGAEVEAESWVWILFQEL